MKIKMTGFLLLALAPALCAKALVPSYQAYANGTMMYAFPYDSARTGVSVQVRAADDADWGTVAGSYGRWNSMATWTCRTNFPGKLAVRIAAVTADGVGTYDAAPDLRATRGLPGMPLNSSDAILDGCFDHTDMTWAGIDLGSVVKIAKLRYNFRFDSGIPPNASRWNGSTFQIASDSTFDDAQVVHTVSSASYVSSTMHEVTFDPPLETRYIRQVAGQYSSLNEVELLDEEGESVPVAFPQYDLGNTNNLCRWSTSDFADSASNCLERSRFSTGPWTAISGWRRPGERCALEDLTAKVGIEYWYRVRSVTTNGVVETSVAVSHRRLRGLDRDPSDLTTLLSDVSVYQTTVGNVFDGNEATFADVKPSDVPVGCIFGEKCYLAGVRYLGRPNNSARVNGSILYGSNDVDEPLSDPVRLSLGFVVDSAMRGYTVVPFPAQQGYQVLFARNSGWYGNLCELNFFGWSDGDIEAAGLPRYPSVLTVENGDAAGSVDLAWSGGMYIDTYDVQCRKKGDDAWTTAASGLPSATESHTVTDLESGTNYEFRVVGYGADESGVSPTATCFVYHLVPGSGTGLKAVVFGAADCHHLAQAPTVEKSVWATAEIDQTGGSLFTNAAHAAALVMLHGKLIAPLSGKYTLSLVTSGTDGQSLWVDGVERINVGVSGGTCRWSATLAAGEHPISITYRSVNDRKYLHFGWALEDVWTDQAVPQSQLVPAEEADYTDFTAADSDGWQISPQASVVGHLSNFKWHGDGSFRISGGNDDYSWNKLTLLTRSVRGSFDFSLTLKSTELSGRPAIFVTDESGSASQAISFIYTGSNFGMKGNAGDLIYPAWPGAAAGTTKLRILRAADRTLTFYVKNGVYGNLADDADWYAFRTLPQGLWTEKGIDLSGATIRIGFNQFYGNGYAEVRDFRVTPLRPGTRVLVR